VADDNQGLRVVDVSSPANPVEVGFYDTPGFAADVAVSGNYANVADESRGLRVVDISNPTNPVEVGFYDTPREAGSVAVAGDYAYVADWDGGLFILKFYPPYPTDTTITSDAPDASQAGETFTVSVAVTSDQAIPTGEVTVTVSGSSASCTATLVDGLGDCQLTLITSGEYTLTASYAGALGLLPSSDTEQHTVVKASTLTTITSAIPDPSKAGEPFTVSFEVTSPYVTPTGDVTVTVSDSPVTCSATLVDGVGDCQLTIGTPSNYTLTATYEGTTNFSPSSDTEEHSVIPATIWLFLPIAVK
jgi:hypothetical protein